jgi:hypothetical protein
LTIDEYLIHRTFALDHEAKLLPRLKKIGWQRYFDALPFNSITAGVEEVLLECAVGRLNCRAARVIPYVQLPLVQRQTQHSGLLGVTERRGGKQGKTL